MSIKNALTEIIINSEKIVTFCCFGSVLCFNALCFLLSCIFMFTYDGGANNPKSYYEIRDIETAQKIFSNEMLDNWLYGLLFALPLVWYYFFKGKIKLNDIFIQLLPTLILVGFAVFS